MGQKHPGDNARGSGKMHTFGGGSVVVAIAAAILWRDEPLGDGVANAATGAAARQNTSPSKDMWRKIKDVAMGRWMA